MRSFLSFNVSYLTVCGFVDENKKETPCGSILLGVMLGFCGVYYIHTLSLSNISFMVWCVCMSACIQDV